MPVYYISQVWFTLIFIQPKCTRQGNDSMWYEQSTMSKLGALWSPSLGLGRICCGKMNLCCLYHSHTKMRAYMLFYFPFQFFSVCFVPNPKPQKTLCSVYSYVTLILFCLLTGSFFLATFTSCLYTGECCVSKYILRMVWSNVQVLLDKDRWKGICKPNKMSDINTWNCISFSHFHQWDNIVF